EAGAGGVEVEGTGGDAQVGGHLRRGRGERHLGRGGGHHHDVEVGGGEAGPGQRVAGGRDGQGAGRLGGARPPALVDAGALEDPVVRGVEVGGEVVVGDPPLGQRGPQPGDPHAAGRGEAGGVGEGSGARGGGAAGEQAHA